MRPQRRCWHSGLCVAAGSALAAGACTVSSTGLAFGAYQPLTFAGKLTSADKTSTATVSVVCSAIAAGGSYTVEPGGRQLRHRRPHQHPLPEQHDQRRRPHGVQRVYQRAATRTVWGNGSVGSLLSGSIPTGNSNQSHTVYGKVPGGQSTLKAGSYATR